MTKWILFQTDGSGGPTGGFRTVEYPTKPFTDFGEVVLRLERAEEPSAAIQRVTPHYTPVFRVHGLYEMRVSHAADVYRFPSLESLRKTLRELIDRYDGSVQYQVPFQKITSARLRAGIIQLVVQFEQGDCIHVRYVPDTVQEDPNVLTDTTEKASNGMWNLRIDLPELQRNRARFGITTQEFQEMEAWVEFLTSVPEPDQLPDMCRIAQAAGTWFRFKIGEFRIVVEFFWKTKTIVWRMLLRRDDETYRDVQHRYEEIYPKVRQR